MEGDVLASPYDECGRIRGGADAVGRGAGGCVDRPEGQFTASACGVIGVRTRPNSTSRLSAILTFAGIRLAMPHGMGWKRWPVSGRHERQAKVTASRTR